MVRKGTSLAEAKHSGLSRSMPSVLCGSGSGSSGDILFVL